MKKFLPAGAGLMLFCGAAMRSAAAPAVELLWPGGAPGALGTAAADKPSLTLYPVAANQANGAAVVVCPGGGYVSLAMDHEGYRVAQWLNTLGVSAFVLQYRLGPAYRHPVELGDAQRALRWVRANAERFNVDAQRVGIAGFSAGGHLASTAATHFDAGKPASPDSVERSSCRPDFQILIYPVITLDASFTHAGSRNALLGDTPSQALVDLLSNEKQVTAQTPPAFVVHTRDDAVVPFKNAEVYIQALQKAGVANEFRPWNSGPHGFGLADGQAGAPLIADVGTWPGLCGQWLKARGFLEKPSAARPGGYRGSAAASGRHGRDAIGRVTTGAAGPRRPPGKAQIVSFRDGSRLR